MSTRDQILDAFEEILISDGERAATLDAVAAAANVSKGGLLYHFNGKDALTEGLLERLKELAAKDAATMAMAPQGPSAYYVGTSAYEGSKLDSALIATARLVQDATPTARAAMLEIQQNWYELILTEVDDIPVARAILLLGDGLYYNAALSGNAAGDDAVHDIPEDIAGLLRVVELLKQQAGPGA